MILAFILAAAVMPQLRPTGLSPDAVHLPLLTELLPKKVSGWDVRDLPLGDTEFLQQKIAGKLQYDDAIFREYSDGALTAGVHVVYWRPESDSGEDRAHTPDYCFPGAGWQCIKKLSGRKIVAGQWESLPAQYRIFEQKGQRTEVLFWHLRAKHLCWASDEGLSRWERRVAVLKEKLSRALSRRYLTDEVFVRITTPDSIDDIVRTKLFEQVEGALAATGAFHRSKQESADVGIACTSIKATSGRLAGSDHSL